MARRNTHLDGIKRMWREAEDGYDVIIRKGKQNARVNLDAMELAMRDVKEYILSMRSRVISTDLEAKEKFECLLRLQAHLFACAKESHNHRFNMRNMVFLKESKMEEEEKKKRSFKNRLSRKAREIKSIPLST